MNITYDKQADALYLRLRDGKAARQRIYTDDVIVDLDDAGNPLGIEVLDLTAADATSDLARLVREYSLDPGLLDAIARVRALAPNATQRVIVA
ncbi:MAG TPA: DUF2283 domain-containing protein [bacterium]|nr:DUF2283 domain-containing protein [bacterium]